MGIKNKDWLSTTSPKRQNEIMGNGRIKNRLPERKHLKNIDVIRKNKGPDIFFVTICSFNRSNILTQKNIAELIITAFESSKHINGWAIGHYVIMPDHVHFFCAPAREEKKLYDFIRDLKGWTTNEAQKNGSTKKLWQREFFDHLLRSDESYETKWNYVRNNPVRAGLVSKPEEWQLAGVIDDLI